MNELLKKLCGGDLRSDGRADDVAEEVMETPQLLPLLVEGLQEPDDVVRGRTAHVLEKISRKMPAVLQEYTGVLIESALEDDVPMVKWHLAMIFGNIASEEKIDDMVSALIRLLKDESVFVKAWSIVSLCIIGQRYKENCTIIDSIKVLQKDDSTAVRTKARKALAVLEHGEPLPAGWYKRKR